jgi:hypothetical protein
MPVKRRLSKQHDGRITPTVVAAYKLALELREWAHLSEADRLAAHDAERVVDRALQIRLWQTSVFDVADYRQPGDPDWERAAELRRRLDAALDAAAPVRVQTKA